MDARKITKKKIRFWLEGGESPMGSPIYTDTTGGKHHWWTAGGKVHMYGSGQGWCDQNSDCDLSVDEAVDFLYKYRKEIAKNLPNQEYIEY